MHRLLALVAIYLIACAAARGPSSSMAPAAAPAAKASSEASAAGRYLPLFDGLVAQIRRKHVFAPSYERVLGGPFAAVVVPRLRARMAAARDRREAMVVIAQLQNSIRDGHCRYEAPGDVHPRWLSLGIKLHATIETVGGVSMPILRVAEHEPRRTLPDGTAQDRAIPIGSRISGIDGVEVGAWLAAHPFETSALVPAIALQRTADSIVAGSSEKTGLLPGAGRTLSFVRPDRTTGQVALRFAEPDEVEPDEPEVDHPPPTDAIECDASQPSPYGAGYALTATGVFLCVYAPVRGPKVPIVRYLSFFYTDGRRDQAAVLRQIKIDHGVLKTALAGAKGVVLDLHQNHGGNNPFLFFRWFAKKPWSHEFVRTRVLPEFSEETVRATISDPLRVKEYLDAQKSGKAFLESRFLCLPPAGDLKAAPRCDDIPPIAGEQVTAAKIAVIVGPACISSCDTFALSWSHFSEGPIIGRQPAHAYTVQRHQFSLAGPKGEDLGQFCVGLSSSHLGSEQGIEGEPIKLDVEIPDRFDNRDTWVREAVEQAKRVVLRR